MMLWLLYLQQRTGSTTMTTDSGNTIDSEEYIDNMEVFSSEENENIDNVKQTDLKSGKRTRVFFQQLQ